MKKFVKLFFLVSWLVIIFSFSSQTGMTSGELSNSILRKIGYFLRVGDPEAFVLQYETIFRKLAHFSEYFILGFLAYICLEEFVNKKVLLITIIGCVIYAISDEYHQMYVVGRVFGAFDIFIDSVGAYCGSTFIHLIKTECFQEKKQ